MKIPLIETARLRLRGQTRADTAFALGIWSDPEMGRYLSDPPREQVDAAYRAALDELENSAEGYYIIAEDKRTGVRIGTCCAFPEQGGASWDLGYCIHRDFWRQGYAAEMVSAVVEFAKANGAQYATAGVAKENDGSNRVMQRLGFAPAREGRFKKCGTDVVYEEYIYQKKL